MIFRLALFFILAIAALLALYFATRKTWNWNRYASALATIFSIFLLVPLAIIIWLNYENRIQVANQIADITLGNTAEEIKLLKGEPAFQIERSANRQFWHYQDKVNTGNFIDLVMQDQSVIEISFTGPCEYCYRINGLGIGTPYQEIIHRLGEPDSREVSADQLEQRLNYPKLQSFFVIREAKVIRHGVYLP